MAQRPLSRSKKARRQLRRVDPKRVLAPEEVDRLKAWCRLVLDQVGAAHTAALRAFPVDPLTVRNAVIVLVLLGTGARRFELCAFRCGDFSLAVGGAPIAYFDQAKGNTQAEIAISEETWQVVYRWKQFKIELGESVVPDAPLFCGRSGEFLSRAQLNNIWDAALKQAGVTKKEGVGVHSSRHAAGLLLLRATNSLSQVSDFLRHASEEVTQKFYRHVLPSDIRAGLSKAGL